MATTCPTEFNVDQLRAHVRETYDRLARAPGGEFHFHRGAAYAVDRLGYDPTELAALPAACTERFAGVGNPLRLGPVHAGEIVLDHACGAGVDLLLAARRVGPRGRAIGVDMTPTLREHAAAGADAAGLAAIVDVRAGLMEDLPVRDASVDLVLSNGVVNLAPDKPRVFREIARVLRPGGRLYLADVVVARELKREAREDPRLWAACIGGAVREAELHELALGAGLSPAAVPQRFDCFGGASAAAKLSADLRPVGANFLATKRRA
jgi:SAM-dependent methyltransferase